MKQVILCLIIILSLGGCASLTEDFNKFLESDRYDPTYELIADNQNKDFLVHLSNEVEAEVNEKVLEKMLTAFGSLGERYNDLYQEVLEDRSKSYELFMSMQEIESFLEWNQSYWERVDLPLEVKSVMEKKYPYTFAFSQLTEDVESRANLSPIPT